jgi:SPP1 gp7 family putative phage head morphogenesis protein
MPPINYDKDGGGGGSSNPVDIYLSHGIYLERYKTHEANKLLNLLDTANIQIKQLISKAKTIETKEKYRRITAEIKRIKIELAEKLNGQFRLDGMELIEEEAGFVKRVVSEAGFGEPPEGLRIVFDADLPAPKKVWASAAFGPYCADGSDNFETYLDGLSDNLYKTWDGQVRAGYLTGMTARQINRAVLGSVKDLEPGLMDRLRKSLETNTRTMVAYLAETARDAVYKENASIFSGYVYLATLDTRTCPVCGRHDGKVFTDLEAESTPKLPMHRLCRCLYLAQIKGREGLDVEERTSVDGPVDGKVTWKDWFARQPEARQLEILGPTRYAMYKAGVDTGSFVTDKRVLTLREVMAKENLALFGEGLQFKSWQERRAYADTYYESIRNRKDPTDIDKISKNTGFSRDDIQSVREHIFTNEHDLGDGEHGRFASNWRMAQAWQRMEQGWKGNDTVKYKEYDLLLLRHEREELTQMEQFGYNTVEAHQKAEGKYPWDVKIKELD